MDKQHLTGARPEPASTSDRRLIAVGILGRTAGRTVSTVRTAAGTTGTVTPPTVTADDDDVREILHALADQLADGPHYRILTEADRLALILNQVTARHGYGVPALNLDREVRRYAPAVGWEITHGEYALIVRRAAGGSL